MVKRYLQIEADPAELIAALNKDQDNMNCTTQTIGDIVVALLAVGGDISKEDAILLELVGIEIKRKDSK